MPYQFSLIAASRLFCRALLSGLLEGLADMTPNIDGPSKMALSAKAFLSYLKTAFLT